MKSKKLGLFAIIIAIGASAFTLRSTKHSTEISYYWFHILNNVQEGAAVPKIDATYLGYGDTPPVGLGCTDGPYQCISGFNYGQVDHVHNQLINNNQVPQDFAYLHN